MPQVRPWQELEIESAADLPGFFDEIVAAGAEPARRGPAPAGRPPPTRARAAIAEYGAWLQGVARDGHRRLAARAASATTSSSGLRAFDGLDADAILEIGERPARDEQGRPDPAPRARSTTGATEATVVDRIKSDHPATFEEALDAYRDVMVRARQHLIDHDIATVPPDERIDVIETPEYLRNVIPFAAYFAPPKFDPRRRASTSSPRRSTTTRTRCASTTSARSATRASTRPTPATTSSSRVANGHPSLTRLLTDAPEFVEGWGMYSEQMMREQGFDAAAELPAEHAHRRDLAGLPDHPRRPDAPGRDLRSTRRPASWSSRPSFEEPNARAEVRRYTYTPTYQLSYLLGKVLLLQLARRRAGPPRERVLAARLP